MREVSILIAPDGSEIVIPIFDPKMERIHRFVGTVSAKVYEQARLRHDQEEDLLEARLMQMSELPKIVSWFSLNEDQATTVTEVAVNWMLGCAERLRASGYKAEAVVGVADVNTAIEDDLQDG